MANIQDLDGEQYCMYCGYWKKEGGRCHCVHEKAKKGWAANQLNGCEYFEGELQPKKDWENAWKVGYRPSTFTKT